MGLLGCSLLLTAAFPEPAGEPDRIPGDIYWITLHQVIDPVAAEFLDSSLNKASEGGGAALGISLDTPGGLDTSMRQMVKTILASPIPIIVYVSPSGSRAASAGLFIAMASHIAAMAPGTNMGAAHPVGIGVGGEMDTVMSEKVTNDAVAYIRSIAEKRGRNADWAEEAVRRSVSLSAEEALRENVIDLIAENRRALIDSLDGRWIVTATAEGILQTEGAEIIELEMGLRERILSIISNPNIAYVLFLMGLMGLFFELSHPGSLLPGILGSICLILAFFAFQTLPVSAAGILLIILAIILFILEIKVTSYGALTIGGVVSLVLGSIMLFPSSIPSLRVSLGVLIPAVVMVSAFFIFAIGMGLRAQRRRKTTGADGLVGEIGKARTVIHREGKVFVHGEIWNAVSPNPIPEATPVRVVRVEGLRIHVEPAREED
ncbi:MAG: nodulation protein NfeD [Candidatus Eisenbacteria bacterium]|uniref:Nodulation protein NfeD n=1 Tax=Eiseniibacteriota bacterium TaxID=2212470 RepID=A0A948RV24_UNCEI|nr:nodulation protein NfeD [Candidatus Eisenbacteria bacterium]MBU1947228.1 nodulation protein NfeD [Candidatus Eisenbacteria bacterium]MBU2690511.1 nodulation protein NfeD [Candidatus Eisenbacteria bacterium]